MAFRAESADCQTADPTVDVWFLPLRVFSLLAEKKDESKHVSHRCMYITGLMIRTPAALMKCCYFVLLGCKQLADEGVPQGSILGPLFHLKYREFWW